MFQSALFLSQYSTLQSDLQVVSNTWERMKKALNEKDKIAYHVRRDANIIRNYS